MRHAGSAIIATALILFTVACDSTEPLRPAEAAPASAVEQTAVVGTQVAARPAVRVTSTNGTPVPGIIVSFAVTGGGGTITDMKQPTDEQGVARLANWTLGTTAGANSVAATVDGITAASVIFRATAVPGPPNRLFMVTQPPALAAAGTLLSPQPAVRLQDSHGNDTHLSGIIVTAQVAAGGVLLEGASVSTDAQGVAQFQALAARGGAGAFTLSFTAAGLPPVDAGIPTVLVTDGSAPCLDPRPLQLALGESRRATMSSSERLDCLEFDMARNQGQQFLLMLENMPMYGGSTTALFSQAFGSASPTSFEYVLRSAPRAAAQPLALRQVRLPVAPQGPLHSWDFGDGPIYEIQPEEPAGGVASPMLLRPHGQLLDINAAAANPQVGDTITVRMEGITRLSIPSGNQRAVIRYISDELIFAEDVRLGTTLVRQGGGNNSPIPVDTMAAIAREYAAHAKRQADLLFDGRYNNAISATNGGRIVAVHSMMYADNIWGYTYSSGNYFVWDYWVGTNGSTGGANQTVQRNADNLFMHEIAHMREFGVIQQDPTSVRGFRWLTEGFARFSERLPIASRLLGTHSFTRTDNLVLPLNPIFNGGYFRDDVPTYLSLGSSAFDGYQNSSYVFDYFADQVALAGRDWRAALRQFLAASGRPTALDAVVQNHLGISFPELFTRARIALYLDDIGTQGLPAWTQYHQYQLRPSRAPGSAGAADPRVSFRKLIPGDPLEIEHGISTGSATGYVIDGTQARGSAIFALSTPFNSNAVISITRIR